MFFQKSISLIKIINCKNYLTSKNGQIYTAFVTGVYTENYFQSFLRSRVHKKKVLQTAACLSCFIPFKKNRLHHSASASSLLTDSSISLKIRHVPMEGDGKYFFEFRQTLHPLSSPFCPVSQKKCFINLLDLVLSFSNHYCTSAMAKALMRITGYKKVQNLAKKS